MPAMRGAGHPTERGCGRRRRTRVAPASSSGRRCRPGRPAGIREPAPRQEPERVRKAERWRRTD
ncbi:hypothetical protein ABI59_22645 [Acidobacteria bacterium Mor1]|nr:hypothetical protein ABI59_22645 [Acidobacteria bacterium Mor1]